MNTFNINHLTPYAVGFDRMFERLMDYSQHQTQSTGFPPYNIRKDAENENLFFIELAVAGLDQNDLEVEVGEGALTVRSNWDDKGDSSNLLHRGISFKKFTRKFTLADDIVVKDAEMKNGLLTISLERIVPEAKKPKLLEIKVG